MKNKLLLLLALVAMPAWAGGVDIQLKGSAKSVGALAASLEKEAVYKDAGCTTASTKSGKSAKISCDKTDGALLTFLSDNAAGVRWSISAAAAKSMAKTASGCPVGCTVMHCPPPGGSVMCCNTKTYQPC